jgi:hypothetical protein
LAKANAGYLFVASTTASSRRSSALRTRRDGIRGIDCGLVRTLRHDPQLNGQVCTATAVDDRDTSSFDSARIDEIVFSAVTSGLTLTGATAEDNDRSS